MTEWRYQRSKAHAATWAVAHEGGVEVRILRFDDKRREPVTFFRADGQDAWTRQCPTRVGKGPLGDGRELVHKQPYVIPAEDDKRLPYMQMIVRTRKEGDVWRGRTLDMTKPKVMTKSLEVKGQIGNRQRGGNV